MGETKIDRRRRYTLSVIQEAFFALLAEVGFAKMTVATSAAAPRSTGERSICIARISTRCSMRLSTRHWQRLPRLRGLNRQRFASVRRQTTIIACFIRTATHTLA